MKKSEQKAIVVVVLRELAKIFQNAESRGNYVGFDEAYEIDVVSTLQGLGSDIEQRADEIEKGELDARQ